MCGDDTSQRGPTCFVSKTDPISNEIMAEHLYFYSARGSGGFSFRAPVELAANIADDARCRDDHSVRFRGMGSAK